MPPHHESNSEKPLAVTPAPQIFAALTIRSAAPIAYRGIQIQFWDSGSRWFAFAPGQRRDAEGHPTPEQALETAERFIDQSIR